MRRTGLQPRIILNFHAESSGVTALQLIDRLLDVLDEVSNGHRLLPVISHLTTSDDAKVSATATLFHQPVSAPSVFTVASAPGTP